MKIGIIVGSIRTGRMGSQVGQWVAEAATERTDADYELVELADFKVPLLDGAVIPGMANGQYADANVQQWADTIKGFDGFVFVTAEYNHGVPGVFKNAFDQLAFEWQGKPVAFVSYGFDGGVRAVEQWRTIVSNFSMPDVRAQVPLSLITDVQDGTLAPIDFRAQSLETLFEHLEGSVAERLALARG